MEAVVKEIGGAVRQQRVALHLAEAHAAPGLAALDGLAGERVDGPDGADLELVGDLAVRSEFFFVSVRENGEFCSDKF